MTVPVTVLDYGIGNLLNVVRALTFCGATVTVIDRASAEAAHAERMVLPGVGALGDGMAELRARGFDDLALRFAQTGRPFLGICVGMQMLFDVSVEMGEHQGLGLMAGRVLPVPERGADGQLHRIPHIGWRGLVPAQPWDGSILAGVQPGERVYFVHSFAPVPDDDAVTLPRWITTAFRSAPRCGGTTFTGASFTPSAVPASGWVSCAIFWPCKAKTRQ